MYEEKHQRPHQRTLLPEEHCGNLKERFVDSVSVAVHSDNTLLKGIMSGRYMTVAVKSSPDTRSKSAKVSRDVTKHDFKTQNGMVQHCSLSQNAHKS
jgi:hypothetical protein